MNDRIMASVLEFCCILDENEKEIVAAFNACCNETEFARQDIYMTLERLVVEKTNTTIYINQLL